MHERRVGNGPIGLTTSKLGPVAGAGFNGG